MEESSGARDSLALCVNYWPRGPDESLRPACPSRGTNLEGLRARVPANTNGHLFRRPRMLFPTLSNNNNGHCEQGNKNAKQKLLQGPKSETRRELSREL